MQLILTEVWLKGMEGAANRGRKRCSPGRSSWQGQAVGSAPSGELAAELLAEGVFFR